MKSQVWGGLSILFISSALWAGIDKDRALMELEERILAAFGDSPSDCMKTNVDDVDEFLYAIGQVEDYIDENAKNKMGIMNDTLKDAREALDKKTRDLIIIVNAIPGTRTKDGLLQLGKLIKEYEDRLEDTEKKLGKESFDQDDMKKANEVLGDVIKKVKKLMKHVTKATEKKIKWLERPVKKKKDDKKENDKKAENDNNINKEVDNEDNDIDLDIDEMMDEESTLDIKDEKIPLKKDQDIERKKAVDDRYKNPKTAAQRRAAEQAVVNAYALTHILREITETP